MTKRQARRHHVVSKFYLRYFADDVGQVTTVVLPGDRTFTQSINDASVHNQYYTAIGHDGLTTDVAEQAFGEIEAAAAPAWRAVHDGVWPLPEELRGAMAGWIALQALRGSQVRTSMGELGTGAVQLQIMFGGRRRLRDELDAAGLPTDDEAVNREWISLFENPYQVAVHANHHLQYIANALPKAIELILDRWWLMTTFRHKGLATSDHPVFVVPNERFTKLGLGTGIANADAIHVPLTRRLSLSMHLRSSLHPDLTSLHDDRAIAGSAATALYSNSCTVNSARKMLYHHPADRPIKGLELPEPRTKEVVMSGDPWRFMDDGDRQVLLDAGLLPPDSAGEMP
ncbi:DUF4238 domain-containing protein [Promicromonospora umidemergens]|uniref:DUF4238 domain-containing protein n=1 Tax=Promicromonospora umidemergens TaxID=629679 RepID=UPI0020A5C156|nr:DUF4238 domain-containing protein [Promicromonospora umidemergens]